MAQQIWGKDVTEAIWRLMVAHVDQERGHIPGKLIGQKLEAELGRKLPRPMPPRTLWDHIQRLKRERGDPRSQVEPGQEIEVAQAVRRRLLRIIAEDSISLEERHRANGLNTKDREALAKLAQIADSITQRMKREEMSTRPTSQQQRASAAAQHSLRRDLVAELQAAETAREPEQIESPTTNGESVSSRLRKSTVPTQRQSTQQAAGPEPSEEAE